MTNNAANTSFEQSTLPFGTALPSESSGFSNQVFTSYDRSPIAGLDYAVNRTYSPGQGRFTQVDPIGMASVSLADPQSLNLMAYVQNDPVDFTDPTGLYEPCIHETMTKFLGNLAGIDSKTVNRIAHFTGDGLRAADSAKYAATSLPNIAWMAIFGGGNFDIHFPTPEQIEAGKENFQIFMNQGEQNGDSYAYQSAGFILHMIQDGLGAHVGYSKPAGHFFDWHAPDRVIGDTNFGVAAVETYKLLKNDPNAFLTDVQLKELIDAILAACGDKYQITVIHAEGGVGGSGGGSVAIDDKHSGGDLQIWQGGGFSDIDVLTWWYSNNAPQTINY